jgi:hypothetical protein
MHFGNSVRGVGTTLGNVKGDRLFHMPTRKASYPERVVRSPRPTLEQMISKVTVGTSVSFR